MPDLTFGVADPTKAAQNVLDSYWSQDGDLPRLPVDPVQIARSLGLEVYIADLDEGVSGMLVKDPHHDPEIFLNRQDSQRRWRFTCAHEIGHYMRKPLSDDASWEQVEYRDQRSRTGTDSSEVYANNFAAQLLMPQQAVRALAPRHTVVELVRMFGVSAEAIGYRLQNLGVRARG